MTEKENPYPAPKESEPSVPATRLERLVERYGPIKMLLVSSACFCSSVFVILVSDWFSRGIVEQLLMRNILYAIRVLGAIALASVGGYTAVVAGSEKPSKLANTIFSFVLLLLNVGWLSFLLELFSRTLTTIFFY